MKKVFKIIGVILLLLIVLLTAAFFKYNEKMPAVTRLSDFEIANVINYIQQKWGNQQYVQINTLQEGLKNCK